MEACLKDEEEEEEGDEYYIMLGTVHSGYKCATCDYKGYSLVCMCMHVNVCRCEYVYVCV